MSQSKRAARFKYWYEQRDDSLRRLGYPTYRDYLGSPLWGSIRKRVLNKRRVCEVCGVSAATQVHHRSYSLYTMMGRRPDFLVACCRPCHQAAEFDNDRKVSPKTANRSMGAAAWKRGAVLTGICEVCRKNPPPKGGRLCGNCRKRRESEVTHETVGEAEREAASRDHSVEERPR